MTLDDGVLYEGEWLVGTQVREGKGIQVDPRGSVFEGYWVNNERGKGRLLHVVSQVSERLRAEWDSKKCLKCDSTALYHPSRKGCNKLHQFTQENRAPLMSLLPKGGRSTCIVRLRVNSWHDKILNITSTQDNVKMHEVN